MSKNPNALTAFPLVPLLTTCITAQIPDASGSSNFGIADFRNIMVPMRDGVRLATNVYRPAENGKVVEGKFPVILERTPYGKDNDVDYANHWVKQGYVVILQDVRGRFNSEGVWRFFRDNINNAYLFSTAIQSSDSSNSTTTPGLRVDPLGGVVFSRCRPVPFTAHRSGLFTSPVPFASVLAIRCIPSQLVRRFYENARRSVALLTSVI